MGGGGHPERPGPAGRYLSGLCAAAVGLCAAGWLVLTPFAFGYRGSSHDAKLTDLATGGGLAVVCLVTMIAWAVAWRRALRADGVLTRTDHARRRRDRAAAVSAADPDQVLATLRAMLDPLLVPTAPAALPVASTPAEGAGADAVNASAVNANGVSASAADTRAAHTSTNSTTSLHGEEVHGEVGAVGGEPAADELGAVGEAEWTAPARAAEPGLVTTPAPGQFAVLAGGVIPEPRNGAEMTGGIAVIESMLAEAEARRGFDEEETW